MKFAPLLVIGAFVLAGCTDDSSGPKGLRLGDGTTVDVKPTEVSLGALAGVVVDEAIRPIAGALVIAPAGAVNLTTDDQGVFAWNDLEPGTYFLVVTAAGYLATQIATDVLAGETAFVRVQLLADLSPKPFHTTYKHEGFMQAWGGIGQFYVENFGPSGTCDCRMYFTPDPAVGTFIYEAFWESSTPDPAGLAEFYYILDEGEGELYEADYCFSPCYARIGGKGYTGKEVMARLDGPDAWTAVQQPITIVVTTFHNGEAPDGWSITDQ